MGIITTAARMWLTRTTEPFRFTAENDTELAYRGLPGLGLYVHIPFCRSLCNFCPYCKQVYKPDTAAAYTDALVREIHHVGAMGQGVTPATSLYFGGGTPALLAPETKRIISALREHFDWHDGTGTELHPADVNIPTLTALKEAGVTRISIGIQSFQPEFAKLLGRPAPDPTAMAEALAAVPFETVSMDFIFALPGQGMQHIGRDLETAFSHGANHVAIYPFIDFTFTRSKLTAMQKGRKRELLDAITDYCQRKGYVRDSIWTFAKPGGHRYSSMTRDTFLGFGCSATSLLRDSFKINTFSVDAYIRRVNEGKLPTSLTTRFSPRQRMVYYMFWRFYSTFVSKGDFREFFGKSVEREFALEIWAAKMYGLLVEDADGYRLTPKGAFAFHYYESFYTLSYIDKMWGILRREDFPQEIVL